MVAIFSALRAKKVMTSISSLHLSDIASTNVLTVSPEDSIATVISLFAEKRVSSIIVVEHGRPIGIVTERDLLRLLCAGVDEQRSVRAIMSAPLLTARENLEFSEAQLMMSSQAIRHLVLVGANGELKGVASETDFRRHLGADLFAVIQSLSAVMDQSQELIAPDVPLSYALELMAAGRLDHVIVGRDSMPVGILTERDIPKLLARHVAPASVMLGDVMTSPLQSIGVDTPVADAAQLMEQRRLRHLVVVNADGRMLGVISQHRMLERLSIILREESHCVLENRLGMVLEATGVGIWEFDHRSNSLSRSQSLNRLLAQKDTLTSQPLDDFLLSFLPEDRKRAEAVFRKLAPDGADGSLVDFQIVDAAGRARWIGIRGQQVWHDPDGSVLLSAGVVLDVSARRLVQTELDRSEIRFRHLIENVSLPLCHVNEKGDLVFINKQFTELLGYTLEDIPNLDDWWQRAYPDAEYRAWVLETWNQAVSEAAASGTVISPVEYRVTTKDGSQKSIEISGMTLGNDVLATFVDVTERRAEQDILEYRNAVLEMMTRKPPLAELLEFVVREIETRVPEVRASVLLLDEAGKHLHHGAAPSLPTAFTHAIDGAEIGPEQGSCGTAAFLGGAVHVADIASDPLWQNYKDLALLNGLAACWSTPIMLDKRVVGTFALYWGMPRPTISPVLRQLVDSASALMAVAIGNDISEKRALASKNQLALFVRSAPMALAMFDRDMRYLLVSDRWISAYHLTVPEIIGRSHYEVFPEIPEHWKAIHQRGLAGETIRNDAECFWRLDGSAMWLRWEVQPWYSGDGSIGGILVARMSGMMGERDGMITYLKIRKTNEVTESTTASARSAGMPTMRLTRPAG